MQLHEVNPLSKDWQCGVFFIINTVDCWYIIPHISTESDKLNFAPSIQILQITLYYCTNSTLDTLLKVHLNVTVLPLVTPTP